jgi:hypothetical protein
MPRAKGVCGFKHGLELRNTICIVLFVGLIAAVARGVMVSRPPAREGLSARNKKKKRQKNKISDNLKTAVNRGNEGHADAPELLREALRQAGEYRDGKDRPHEFQQAAEARELLSKLEGQSASGVQGTGAGVSPGAESAPRKSTQGSYDYAAQIKTPAEIGSSPKGTYTALGKDVHAFVDYINVLVSGDSGAQKVDGPLGNKYFLPTSTKCKDTASGTTQVRSVYIDNVPTGSLPLFTGTMGSTVTQYKGLVPGVMEGVASLDPGDMMSSMLNKDTSCSKVKLKVVDVGMEGWTSTYVLNSEIPDIYSCNFFDGVNPATGATCPESFSTRNREWNGQNKQIPDDPFVRVYFLAIGLFAAYIVYRTVDKGSRR